MRIPSQFNDDNLYRRDRRLDRSASAYRRIIRLTLGLALVVVVMNQASQHRIYEPFFGSSSTVSATITTPGDSDEGTRIVASDEIDAEDRRIADKLVQRLAPSDQRKWGATLMKWQHREDIGSLPSTLETLVHEMDAINNLSDQRRKSWKNALNSQLAQTSEPRNASTQLSALMEALDDAAFRRVVDGSVWRGADFDAFYLSLDQADRFDPSVASVGVVPLLQQPEVYRGSVVRVTGMVARAEPMIPKENAYGIGGYWQLWIRPSDGADRPLVAIVRSVPDSIAAVGQDVTLEDGPKIEVVGKFLKRLAYQSGAGAELAPVIVGRLTRIPVTTNVVEQDDSSAAGTPPKLWFTIGMATVVGLVIAAVMMWRTAVAARRTRELRNAKSQANALFLKELDDMPKEPE